MIEHDGCTGCKHFNNNEVTHSSPCYDCEGAHSQNKLKDNYTPMSNADKIRAMSDEDIAQSLFDFVLNIAGNPDYIKNPQGYLEWLQSEVKE